MKPANILLAVFIAATLSISLLSCSKDEESEPIISKEDQSILEHEKLFRRYKDEIVGSWDACDVWIWQTDTGIPGWYPVTEISLITQNWTFNSDFTGYENTTHSGVEKFTYEIFKSPVYSSYGVNAPVLVKITYNDGFSRTYGVEIDNNMLRLYNSPSSKGYPYISPKNGGIASVRYKKR